MPTGDRDRAMDACADHSWNVEDLKERADLELSGIRSQAQARQLIDSVVNDPQTRAVRCHPKLDKGHPVLGEQFGREIYMRRGFNAERGRVDTVTVVLNRNEREGRVIGGTVTISKSDPENRLRRQEMRDARLDRLPEVVVGGRPALREQERHRQVVASPSRAAPSGVVSYTDRMAELARRMEQQQPQQPTRTPGRGSPDR